MRYIVFIALLFGLGRVNAQELQAKFTVVANRVSNQVDKKTFSSAAVKFHALLR